MSAATTSPTEALQRPPRSEHAMERLAWVVMLGALLAFFGAGGAAAILGRSLLQYQDATTEVAAFRGVVLYRPAGGGGQEGVDEGTALYRGDQVFVSAGSAAVLTPFDGSRIELFSETRTRVLEARTPRVGIGASLYRLGVDAGAIRLTVAEGDPETRRFEVTTPHGTAQLSAGDYTVRAAPDASRISVWQGKATVMLGNQVVDVNPGRKLVVSPDGSFHLGDVLENVLANGSFTSRWDGWSLWEQHEPKSDAKGELQVVALTEPNAPGLALRIVRDSPAGTHNETGLDQRFARDVRGARAVYLDLWLKVDYASLSGGGYLGTEYPLMVRVRYATQRGSEEVWTRGFYYANPEQRPTPDGELVERGKWTHYRADLTNLPGTPSLIEMVQIVGAGHSFDASVADVKLLVD
jgi:hypothetical protein